MDVPMSPAPRLSVPFPTMETDTTQIGEKGAVAANRGPARLPLDQPKVALRESWPRLFRTAIALMALSPLTAVYAQHASDDPLATANDAFGLTLGLESIGLYGPGSETICV